MIHEQERHDEMTSHYQMEGNQEQKAVSCIYCNSTEDTVPCDWCGKKIPHDRKGYSISHTCFECNVDLGKGE